MYVVINGLEWQIKRVNPYDVNLFRDDGTLTVGMTDRMQMTIFLNDKLKGLFLRKVLVHELVHAWIFSYGYILSVQQEEFICDFISSNADDILNKADELICTGYFRVAL